MRIPHQVRDDVYKRQSAVPLANQAVFANNLSIFRFPLANSAIFANKVRFFVHPLANSGVFANGAPCHPALDAGSPS